MNLLTKVLKVNGEKTVEYPWDGGRLLYTRGTTRIVRTYLFFPRNIGGERVRGSCTLEQVADIDAYMSPVGEEFNHYNKWINKRVISRG